LHPACFLYDITQSITVLIDIQNNPCSNYLPCPN
jgi:hypothetical protein